jgi:hypothetical protein
MLTTNLPAQRVCSGHPPPTTERLLRKASSRYATSGHGNCLESDALASSLGRTHARMATNRPRAAGDRRQSTGTRPAVTHVLSFPCRLTDEGWINSRTASEQARSTCEPGTGADAGQHRTAAVVDARSTSGTAATTAPPESAKMTVKGSRRASAAALIAGRRRASARRQPPCGVLQRVRVMERSLRPVDRLCADRRTS